MRGCCASLAPTAEGLPHTIGHAMERVGEASAFPTSPVRRVCDAHSFSWSTAALLYTLPVGQAKSLEDGQNSGRIMIEDRSYFGAGTRMVLVAWYD